MSTRKKQGLTYGLLLGVVLAAFGPLEILSSTAFAGENPVPMINQPLVPDAIAPGGAGFILVVHGTGFVSGAVVNWNDSSLATTFVKDSQLTATVPASDIAAASTASVTVVNPSPGGGTSNVMFFAVTPSSSSIALSAPSAFGAGTDPDSAAAGDFNGDGKLDLAVANEGSNNVSILLGKSDGTFQAAVDYGAGSNPSSVAVGDFRDDGKLDLVVANDGSDNVSILLGNGDGTFQAAVNYGVGSAPTSVAVGDFNGDGKLDLAVVNELSNNFSILLGNGDGTFQAAVNYGAGLSLFSVAVGDFNGDGKLDLAVASGGSDYVSVLLGNGDGTFKTAVQYVAGLEPISVAVADFNGDGKLDLAVANYESNNVSILLGKGDGTFQAAVDYGIGTENYPATPGSVAVGDFNGDGKLDLVVGGVESDNVSVVSVLLGNGDGTFQAAVNYGAGAGQTSVAVGDFNGDGRLDLAAPASLLLQTPLASLSSTSLNFGNELVGATSAPNQVTLSNPSGLALTISSVAVTGTNAADFSQTNTCGTGLAVGASCTITVTFKPTQTGPRTASVNITDNAAGSLQTIGLSGTGLVSGPNATPSPSSLTFATQLVGTSSSAQLVALTNYGKMALGIASIAASGDFSQTNTCGSSLAAEASCAISLIFKPTQRGTRTGTLSITDNAAGSPQTVSLTGTGTVVEFNPASLRFGSVKRGDSKALTTTLSNTGNTALSISSITITGSATFPQTNTCGASVAAGASCTITATFRPTGIGSFSGDVSISDSGGGSPQQVPLSGSAY
ncbi:MAG: FG-GAP-like repeat-containing protein [Bryobacteraceae bacterium]